MSGKCLFRAASLLVYFIIFLMLRDDDVCMWRMFDGTGISVVVKVFEFMGTLVIYRGLLKIVGSMLRDVVNYLVCLCNG